MKIDNNKFIDRRLKNGGFEARKLTSDIIRVRRMTDRNIREIESRAVFSASMLFVCLLLAGLLLICFAGTLHAESIEGYPINTWAEAIHHAEGNDNYGILAHYKHTSYKQACINSVRHSYRIWLSHGKHGSFINTLGCRYCPIDCENDNGTNKYWIDNVKYWLRRLS